MRLSQQGPHGLDILCIKRHSAHINMYRYLNNKYAPRECSVVRHKRMNNLNYISMKKLYLDKSHGVSKTFLAPRFFCKLASSIHILFWLRADNLISLI